MDTDVNFSAAPAVPDAPPSAPDTCSPNLAEIRSTALGVIGSKSVRAALPVKWRSFVPKSDSVRQLQMRAVELATELKRGLSEADLLAAGVFVQNARAVKLAPAIGDVGSKFTMELDASQLPKDLHGEFGALFQRRAVALSWGTAHRKDGSTECVPVMLCETVEDVQILRALKCEAVSSIGLDRLSCRKLAQLLPAQPENDHIFQYRLVIVDWSVADITGNRRARAGWIIDRLVSAQRLYSTDPARRFTVWRPDSQALQDFRAAARCRDTDLLRQQLFESLPEPAAGLDWRDFQSRPAPPYATARKNLDQALQASKFIPRPADVQRALDGYLSALEQCIVNKFYERVSPTVPPLDCLVGLSAADLAQRWIESDPLVIAARAVCAGKHPDAAVTSQSERLNERLKIANQLEKLLRASQARR